MRLVSATPLAEGDIVRIYPIVPAYQKTVGFPVRCQSWTLWMA